MPEKRTPPEITQQDVEELEKLITELKKKEIVYPEAGGGEMIIKDACKVTYPEPKGGEMLIKKDGEIDTHRVELKKLRPVPKVKITGPEDIAKFASEMEDMDREYFKILWLDTKNRVIGVETISIGSINQAIIHPREVAKGAILANAAGVALLHNHPSGIPEPSIDDDIVIGRLKEVFNLVGIQVIDALVIGREGYYSYMAKGRLDKQLLGGSERLMESKVKEDDACSTALRAAMETMQKYCGEGMAVVEVDGMQFTLPYEVLQIRENADLTHDQRVKAIQESLWAQNEARGLCGKLFGQETPECIERVSRKLAEGMVSKEPPLERAKKITEKLIHRT